MRRFAILVVLVLSTSCGGDESTEAPTSTDAASQLQADLDAIPTCVEAYQEGQPVTNDPDKGCYDSGGSILFGFGSTDCVDGTVLWWSDLGWYIEGDTFHEYEPGAELVPPADVRAACEG